MHHIDEHTLELYALKAEEIAGRVDEIEAHLQECHGCRALVEEMRGYYSDLEEEFKQHPDSEVSAETALVKRQMNINPHYEPFAPPMRYQPNTPLAKIYYFVRRHPVVATMSSFAMVGLLGWFLNDAVRGFKSESKITDKNPAYTNYDVKENLIRVYNKENQELWSKRSPYIKDFDQKEYKAWIKYTCVADLNIDGSNEIITSLSMDEDREEPHRLTVFEKDGKLRWELGFARTFLHEKREYDPRFFPGPIVIGDFSGDSKNGIICVAANPHSPSYLARIDANGNILGEYWHFGHLININLLDLDKDGKNDLIVQGLNDLADSTHDEFPVIIVLDPAKLSGVKSSSVVSGFELPPSDAELFYIGLPPTDMSKVLRQPLGLQRLEYADDGSILLAVTNNLTDGPDVIWFQYRFSSDMKLMTVKSSDQTDKIYDKLVAEGKLAGRLDETYRNNLKMNVRYWDGKEWRKEWAMVNHQP